MVPREPCLRAAFVAVLLMGLHAPALAKSGAPAGGARVSVATEVDLKMDAPLRLTLERYRERLAAAGAGHDVLGPGARLFESALPFGRLRPAAGGEPEAQVFVRLEDAASASSLRSRGADILVQEGDLALARIPISRIAPLASAPEVRSLSGARDWGFAIDSSRIRSRVLDVHLGGGGTLPQAYLGSGVIVGVLDSGLDYTHPDFRTSATDSRLLGLFDFSAGIDGGECRPGQVDSLTCPEIDGTGGHGHGTHVTGIAAGNARLNLAYVGMAPQADLLFVKGLRDAQSNGGFSDADVVQGVAWMINKALVAGKPIAVNLSLGGQLGAHDGTSLQEQFLDRFSGPGRVIVAAAGNSGGPPIHASYIVQGTDYATALESLVLMTSPSVGLDLWAPAGSNIRVGVVAYNPADLTTPMFVTTAAAPGQLVQQTATFQGTAVGDVTIDARTTADPNNGARNVLVLIQPSSGGFDPSTLLWSVYTFGSGTFDMWAFTGSFIFPPGLPAGIPAWFRGGDDSRTVAIPATAKRLLCVGSHVTKTQWIDIDDQLRTQPGATLDQISGFSSRGPSRDGRVLPNFTAPGEAIISALSANFPADRQFIAQGGGYQEQQGTSQAAPHVTGIAALMLQRDPALTPENVRSILQQTATPAGTGNPNNVFGRGRIQALAALQGTPDPLQCTVTLANGQTVACDEAAGLPYGLMAYPNPAPGLVRFSVTAPSPTRLDVAVYDVMGRRARTLLREVVDPGVHSVAWDGVDEHGHPAPDGVYFVRLLAPAANRTIRLVLRR